MIIKLKGASFSEAVTIGTEMQYDSNVDNLFVNGYLKTASKKQKVALSNFLSNLHTENLWDKITGMYIPILGNSVSDALLNVKTSYGGNNILDSYPNGVFEMDNDNKGIKGTNMVVFDNVWPDSSWYSTSVNYSNFHQCIVATDYKPTHSQKILDISTMKKSTYNGISPFIVVCKSVYKNTINLVSGVEKPISLQNPTIVCLNAENSTMYNGNNTYFEATEAHTDNDYLLFPFFTGVAVSENGNTTPFLQGLKFMSFGKSMTQEEMQKYYELVKTLVDSLLEL